MAHVMRASDKWIPWYFVAFFVVLALVDGVFVVLATSTHQGVVTEHAYQKGLEYNKTIAAAEAQDALGWKSRTQLEGDALVFTLTDAEGLPLSGAEVEAVITRPTKAGSDFSISLEPDSEGRYKQRVAFPMQGLWEVRVIATWNGQRYQKGSRIVVQ